MKAFGLEIRKADNMKNLYRDVDNVLSGLPKGEINKEVQIQAVAHALHNMMKPDKWFDICAVRNCMNLTGIFISAERMTLYSTAHCIHWNEMVPEYRQTLMCMILDDFRPVLCPEEETYIMRSGE